MIYGLILLLICWLLYLLLIKGYLYKLILLVFGWIGIFLILGIYFPITKSTGIIAFETMMEWRAVIPTIIVLLALVSTKIE